MLELKRLIREKACTLDNDIIRFLNRLNCHCWVSIVFCDFGSRVLSLENPWEPFCPITVTFDNNLDTIMHLTSSLVIRKHSMINSNSWLTSSVLPTNVFFHRASFCYTLVERLIFVDWKIVSLKPCYLLRLLESYPYQEWWVPLVIQGRHLLRSLYYFLEGWFDFVANNITCDIIGRVY